MQEALRQEVKRQIEKKGFSLRRLEAECGVSSATLSRFLRGKDLSIKSWKNLNNWIQGRNSPKSKPLCVKRFRVGNKSFLITIEELK